MRIVFVTNLFPPQVIGGAERMTARQANALAAAGHDVHVITTYADVTGWRPRWQHSNQDGVSVHRMASAQCYHFTRRPSVRVTRPLWHLLDVWNPLHNSRLRRQLTELQPDIVIFGNLWNIGTSVWAVAPPAARTIQILHDGATVCLTGLMQHGESECRGDLFPCRIFRLIRRRQSRALELVLAPSQFLLRAALDEAGLFPQARAALLPNSVPPMMSVGTRETTSSPLRVLYLGQLAHHKGVLDLANAVKGLDGMLIQYAGAGALYDAVAAQSGANVELIGHLSRGQIAKVLAQTHVLVVPSIAHENSPAVIDEAYAAGVPVLASRIGGIPEMVDHGSSGFLFPPGDSAALRSLLVQLRDDRNLLRTLTQGAMSLHQSRFANAEERSLPLLILQQFSD